MKLTKKQQAKAEVLARGVMHAMDVDLMNNWIALMNQSNAILGKPERYKFVSYSCS